jgi:hypothetical protein
MNEFELPLRPSRKTLVLSLIGLAAFLAAEALLLRHYIRVDTRPPSWEQAVELQSVLEDHESPAGGGAAAVDPAKPLIPPAYRWLMNEAFDAKDPAHAGLWINWGYMAVLALSLFAISWRFLPDSRALAATLALCAAPGLQDLLTTPIVDLSLVALVTAGYWALLESDGFTYWLPSVAFGVLHAVGMLHKWSYMSYMLPAYLIAARALGDRNARLKVLAAAAASGALFLPWYSAHLTALPAALARSWAEGGGPLWRDGGWANAFAATIGETGPLLWILGLISLLAPQYTRRRENGWVLAYWVAFSCAAWAFMPDRQMRCFIPALVPLGLAMAATWPKNLTWSVTVVQLVCALNFFYGIAGPVQIPTPFVPLTFLQNRPPAREDWKIADILARIESARDKSRDFTPVAFVANDEEFNPATFRWTQSRLKLPHALFRGVNKRLSELSEFLLLKQGRLGPEDRIGDLAEAAKALNAPESWFPNAYEQADKWPLPDGSTAVLYRQRGGRAKPASDRRLAYAYLEAGKILVHGMNIDLGAWDQGASVWPTVMLSADRVDADGVTVRGIAADLVNFSIFPLYEGGRGDYAWNDMRLMRLDRVIVRSAQIDAAEIKKYAEKRMPWMTLTSLTLDGTLKASGSWNGRPVALEASIEVDRPGRRLHLRVISASYMGMAIPPVLFGPVKELDYSLAPTPERPFFLDVSGVTLRNDRITIP